MHRGPLAFLVAAISLLVLFILSENLIATGYPGCIDNYKTQASGKYPSNEGQIIARVIEAQAICSLRLIDRHNGFFSSVAALIVGAFTFTLWLATRNHARHMEHMVGVTKSIQRAFVFVEGFNYELTTMADTLDLGARELLPEFYKSMPEMFITRFAIQPRWKNSGNTPTKNMAIQTNWCGPPSTIPPQFVYEQSPVPFFLAPKAIEAGEFIEIRGTQSIIDHGLTFQGDEPLFFVWGRATYEDTFGQDHFVEWCYRIRYERHRGERLRMSFIQSGNYNRSDEDIQ